MVLANDIAQQETRLCEIVSRLHAAGRRVGPSRMAALRALVSSDTHPGAEEIYDAARRQHPSVSRGTVYRTLDALREVGEVLELGFHDSILSANRYDGRRAYSHPHLVCTECRAIIDIAAAGGIERSLMEEAARSGFQVERYRMDLYGRCPACQHGTPSEAAGEYRRTPTAEEDSDGRIARHTE